MIPEDALGTEGRMSQSAGRGSRTRAPGVLAVFATAASITVAFTGLAGCSASQKEKDAAISVNIVDSADWVPVGLSVKGRPIEAITVGKGPRRILVIGGIHGDEREAHPSVTRLVNRLGGEEASSVATWRIIRDLNPDGSALARRGNGRQIDLNRNFPARNFEKRKRHGPTPLSEPESVALMDLVRADQPSVIIVFHSSAYGPFVNFDGPGAGVARAFADGAAEVDERWRLVPEMSYATPGSLGSYFGVDQGIPVLTIEFLRGQEPLDAWRAIEAGFNGVVAHLSEEPAQHAAH